MKSVWTYDPLEAMESLRREINRVFNGFGEYPAQAAFLPGLSSRSYPRVNVYEDDHAVYVTALAPGVDPDSFNISVQQNRLTISGEKPGLPEDIKPEDYHRCERAAGQFVRNLVIPADIDRDAIAAEYRNGVLTVTIPKKEPAKPRRIDVSVS